jgi:ribonuclease I
MKTTATMEAVSSSPEDNELWSQQWRRNTTCAGQKPRADWKNDLQTYEESRRSPKPPTPVVGKKPYGKSQLTRL